MKKPPKPVDWAQEFREFVEAPGLEPPAGVSKRIVAHVESELNPPAARVFGRLGLIQVFVGAFVLLFCPQFGLNLFPGMGLMSLFMRFGEGACMMGCGAVFLGTSGLVGALVLRPEEIRVVRSSRPLQLGLMALLSTGVFVCLGADMVVTLGLAWVVGSVVGGLASLELGWVVRMRLSRRHA